LRFSIMARQRILIAWSLLALIAAASSAAHGQTTSSQKDVEFFEKKIRPILAENCYACHSAETKPAGNLRVDDRNGLLAGGSTGPAIVPGDPAKSLLLLRVTHKDKKRRMPQEGQPLTKEQVADLTTWINSGAAWPKLRVPASLGKANPKYKELKQRHWAWQPLTAPQPPSVRDTTWPKSAIDRFILARLEAENLKPVADAGKLALIRRATFDLTGLPPTPGEIDAFLRDFTEDAFERVVDRLLASPRFGERWGRHWLDVARYGESTGPSRNIPYPHAWKYRDYVIDAINADIPFDQFVREQIAGDLLPAASDRERVRLLTATGFLALGVKDVNQRFKTRFVMDNVDEQIDAVSRSVLALTVSCARCHDHKFDPIPTTDYYALAGIFTSTDICAGLRNKMGGGGLDYYDPSMLIVWAPHPPENSDEKAKVLKGAIAQAKKEWETVRGTPRGLAKGPDGVSTQEAYRLKYQKLQRELFDLTDPAAHGYTIHGVREANKVSDTQVRIRGEAEKLGPTVARGFLTAFDVPQVPELDSNESGRLALARWLTSSKNPLTARVIANRVWQHLFGQGIVRTVDNFGVLGDTPSHQELLDYLANRLIWDRWSVKKLVRAIVLTRAYQLGSAAGAPQRASDPTNRLIWRHAPRRLDAEEIRDAMLAAAGRLNLNRPAGSAAMRLKMIEIPDSGPEARAIRDRADRSTNRSVYLPLLRGVSPRTLEAFDPVEQGLVTGTRDATTTPRQALYLLNSPFVRRQALAMAELLLATQGCTDTERIRQAYRITLGRSPGNKEIERAQTFLDEYEATARKLNASRPPTKPDAPSAPAKAEPANQDEFERTNETADGDPVRPKNERTAAWQSLVQSLLGSAEFRYLR
jgi:cytochrome c553